MKSFKELWIDPKTKRTRIIDGYGDYFPEDPKVIKNKLFNIGDHLWTRIDKKTTVSMFYNKDYKTFDISNTADLGSLESFEKFEDMWKYFQKTYRKKKGWF
jgi:hypothetical protein